MLLEYFVGDSNCINVSLQANPELSDYFHFIEFGNDGKVIIADGGCQMIYGIIKGSYKIIVLSERKIKIKLTSLFLCDPYNESIKFSELLPCEFIVHKRQFYENNSHKRDIYVFEQDPCCLFREYSECYPSKYIPKLSEEIYDLLKSDQENYSANGLYFNKLETDFFLTENYE